GLTQTGGIDEAEYHPPNTDLILDKIPGGSGNVRHDRFFFIKQGVQQGGFPGIRLPGYHGRNAVLYYIAKVETGYQFLNNPQQSFHQISQLIPTGELYILLG